MEKIVKDGLRDCTIILDGSECAVRFDTCFRAFAVRNDSGADVFISKSSGIVPDADGVMCVKSGGSAVFAHNDLDKNAVYLLGTGKVMVHGQQDSNNPFNFAPTIDGGVQASGNPVQLDGLQGGVPFSEITVSGDDIVGQELTVNVSGKNLIPYPYISTTKTINGITFTDNGDGSITANGTATEIAFFSVIWLNYQLKKGTYTISGCPEGGNITTGFYIVCGTTTTRFATDTGDGDTFGIENDINNFTFTLRINSGVTVENLVFRPQLELGDTATEYEPYHGSTTIITPTSNPYIIPNDIRQQDGLNVVSVSEGELSVVGVRKNAAVKKIWDKIDELTTAIIVSNGETIE